MNKRTKILATIGPATESEEQIKKLIEEGVNVFRFNLKHNDHSWHEDKVNLVRKVSNQLNKHVAVVADLQGPDIRIGEVSGKEIILTPGEIVYLEKDITEEKSIQLNAKYLNALKEDQIVLIDDGKHRLQITKRISDEKVEAKVFEGGKLGSKKSVFFPGLKLDVPSLSDKDIEDIKLAAKVDADYVALSFVRNKEDILKLKEELKKVNLETKIISKIETLEAVKKIDEVIEESDALMVARGDLGVEIFLEAVPTVQKRLIKKSLIYGKPVIVATQMLKSMVDNPNPTRAEISDIANAAFDKTDAVMLSEESAIGEYAQKAVSYMARTLKYNEMEGITSDNNYNDLKVKSQTEAVVKTANSLQKFLKETGKNPKYFVVLTDSGTTARFLSSIRPELPILAFTQSDKVSRSLALSWGVEAFTCKFKNTVDESVEFILKDLIDKKLLEKDDSVVITSGQNIGDPGHTDSVRVITV